MNIDVVCNVTCPSCFESFTIAGPAPAETPAEWDYDCEICCRPMIVHFHADGDSVNAVALPTD